MIKLKFHNSLAIRNEITLSRNTRLPFNAAAHLSTGFNNNKKNNQSCVQSN